MTIRKLIKQLLSLSVYYVIRDLYASARDTRDYFLIRREYTNNSVFKNLGGIAQMFFRPKKTILCYPNRPSKYHAIYKLCALCGYKISINPRKKCDTVFWSHNETFPDKSVIEPFIEKGHKVINSECVDLSKKTVGRIFKKVFGYSLDVDPTTYHKTLIEKSIYNGTNFATAIEGPIRMNAVREDYVYQKKIENYSETDDFTVVYRIPIYSGEIPVVYLKYRPKEFRFTGRYEKVDVKSPEEIFSKDELSKILFMNQKMGIDYGECDVLRDADRKIYVVDVNSNPGGPPRKMSHSQKITSEKLLVPSFKEMIEKFS